MLNGNKSLLKRMQAVYLLYLAGIACCPGVAG